MTANSTAIARKEPQTLKTLLRDPIWQKRFEEILGARSAQFVSSVLSVGGSLGADCEPTSIIASAMTAATLDLPVDKNLGFAWIVPYKKSGKKFAQFQMGYKGYVQLGLRTGQYERMNARVINAEAFQGWDEVGEPIIDWSQIDEAKPSVGYVFAFKLVNGFTKIAFWPRERVEAHAKNYSQSFKGGYESPWKSNFDAMALKTVVKNELAKWGILSIEMVNAIKHDQSTKQSLEDEPQYLDAVNGNGTSPDSEAIPVISEEQRMALAAFTARGLDPAVLNEVVHNFGFQMLADITVDKFTEILNELERRMPAQADESAQGSNVTDATIMEPESKTPEEGAAAEAQNPPLMQPATPAAEERNELIAKALEVYNTIDENAKLEADKFLSPQRIEDLTVPKLKSFIKKFGG